MRYVAMGAGCLLVFLSGLGLSVEYGSEAVSLALPAVLGAALFACFAVR